MTNTFAQQKTTTAAGGLQDGMLELGRSMLRFSWAMTVFGAQQAANLVTGSGSGQATPPAADAFDAVAHAVEGQFGGVFRGAYNTGRDWLPGFGRKQSEVSGSKV